MSDAHPQGGYDSSKKYIEPSSEFSDDDFIIARNNNGISSPAHYSFPNALIGTANIAEAAIINAKINDLSADKITAGQIKGHRLEIINSGSEQSTYGSLASKGFSGIKDEDISGFVLSGDGSFAFQQGGSSLTFDDEGLVLRGKLQQKNGLDFDFIDINATPAYFNYVENQDGTFDLLDSLQQSSIEVYFRNSSVTSTSDIQIKIEKFNGSSSSTVIEYTDADSLDLDVYLESRTLNNQTLNTSILASQYDGIIGDTEESIVLYFKNKNSNIERNITIARIVDGKAGDAGNSPSIYYINPTRGTALKNSSGTLEVEAKQIIDGVDSLISSGNIKLYVGTSDKGYDETFNASQINGSVLVELKEGSTVYDTITLIDVTDGENAIVGSVTSNQPLAYVQDKNDGSWSSTSNSALTAEFYKNGSLLHTKTATVTLNSSNGTLSTMSTGITIKGNGSSRITITFTYNNISVSETVYAVRGGDEGAPGNLGSSPSFRGVWNSTTEYIGEISTSPTTPARGDVVYHDTQYYICKDTASGSSQSPTNNSYWEPFGNQFSSVATELLLTKDAFISEKLTLGIDSNSLSEPHSGIIVSAGFTGGIYNVQTLPYNDVTQEVEYVKKWNSPWYDVDFNYPGDFIYIGEDRLEQDLLDKRNDNTIKLSQAQYDSLRPVHNIRRRGGYLGDLGKNQFEKGQLSDKYYETPGFLLARIDDNRAIFDVGGTGQLGNDSYIRFDSNKGKIEIAGSFINNTILAPDFNINNLQFLGDPFGAFVGGGYNNFIGIDETGDFNSLGSAITAGAWNKVESRFSFIGAGYSGDCRDNFSAIVAGYGNSMPLEEPGDHQGANFIGCGIENTISGGTSQSIVNGSSNKISQTLTGTYIPISDLNQGWLAPGFFGQINGSLAVDFVQANFINNANGWIENSWWPASGIQDWGIYNFEKSFYLGQARGVNTDKWIYHQDIGWAFISEQTSKLYKDASFQLYPISKHRCPSVDGFWMWLADFNNTYRGWWWFSKSDAIDVNLKHIEIYNEFETKYHLRNDDGTLQIKLGTSSSWNDAKDTI